ncbi:MAG: VOC family protein [Oscillospiraceae bacterium]
MEYKLPLLAVKDIEASKKFYKELFGQEVVLDLGWNVTLSGGFSLQQNFKWLADLPEEPSYEYNYDMELYFEVEDYEAFIERLKEFPEIKHLHPPKKHDWQQRVVRIFDPDGHIIEIGESMAVIARRYLKEGKTPEETAIITQHPLDFVLAARDGRL